MLFLFLLAQLLAGLFWFGAASVAGIESTVDPLNTSGAWLLVLVECTIAVLALLVMRALGPWERFGIVRGWSVRGWLALLPVVLVMVVPGIIAVTASGERLLAPDLDMQRGAALVVLAVVIAITEELYFRGLMIDVLGGVSRPVLATAVSAVLFGLPHGGDSLAAWLNAAAVTLAVGVPFALVRLRYVSLLPLIGWHAVIDIWAFLHTAEVGVSGTPSTSELLSGTILPASLAASYALWFALTRRPRSTT